MLVSAPCVVALYLNRRDVPRALVSCGFREDRRRVRFHGTGGLTFLGFEIGEQPVADHKRMPYTMISPHRRVTVSCE